jgi:hypothetical protein
MIHKAKDLSPERGRPKKPKSERLQQESGQPLGCRSALVHEYNFCRIHKSLRVTPAMEAGITDHVWEITELLA